ncbi:MAG: N-acetyl-gamma-glutamyl-phosphate reductase [Chloroflexi bacterium]|nr:N-acetyl-gamma-glutamyl-phosphate reductase [Chloroflexota bacterium]
MDSIKVAILNITGYAGVNLARILQRHPNVKIVSVTGRSEAGSQLSDIFPHMGELDITIEREISKEVDLVFSCLPHSASASILEPFIHKGVKVIDLSADFRLNNPAEYESWYETEHPCPEYLQDAVYGLPELHESQISQAKLIASPGCYATASILALAPIVDSGILDGDIIIDAKSGVSGAGRSASLKTNFSEVNENVSAYSTDGHRHLPEIMQEIELLNKGINLKTTMLTHLIPITRGIIVSCYVNLANKDSGIYTQKEINQIYKDFFSGKTFVKISDNPPSTKEVSGTNGCVIYCTIDKRTNRLIVVSVIDNLIKGAAGQAVQSMNIMLGLNEKEGLSHLALYP